MNIDQFTHNVLKITGVFLGSAATGLVIGLLIWQGTGGNLLGLIIPVLISYPIGWGITYLITKNKSDRNSKPDNQ